MAKGHQVTLFLIILVHCIIASTNTEITEEVYSNCFHTFANMSRIPSFAISHGGPNIILEKGTMFDQKYSITIKLADPTVKYFKQMAKDIVNQYHPKAILMISAHWEASEFNIATA